MTNVFEKTLALIGLVFLAGFALVAFLNANYESDHKHSKAAYHQTDCLEAYIVAQASQPGIEPGKSNYPNQQPCDSFLVEARGTVASESEAKWTKIGAIGSVVVGVFTLAIAGMTFFFGYRQWRASHLQSQQEMRAYVSVFAEKEGGVEVRADGIGTLSISLKVQLRNDGNTPAKNVRWYYNFRAPIAGIPSDALAMEDPPGGTDRNPIHLVDIIAHQNLERFQIRGGISDAIDLTLPGNGIYAFGMVVYDDVFGNKDWKTRYCFRIVELENGKFILAHLTSDKRYDEAT